MTKRLQHAVISAYVVLAIAMTMGGIGHVAAQAQGQFEPQVNELLSAFLNCMDRAAIYGGPQNMPLGLERFTCRALMDNSHAALNHIYNAGTLESYSPETQDLAYGAANIIVQHVLPPGVSSNGGGMSAMGESMPSSLSDSFFDALGSGSTSGYLTGGIYGDVCNYTLGSC
jgi:hypothetical protein